MILHRMLVIQTEFPVISDLYRLTHVLQWAHQMVSRTIVQLQEAKLITNF
jgi:hypothetical protein